VLFEVKTGDASLSIRQSAIYPQIKDGESIPYGKVAKDLGLDPGVPLKDQDYPNGIPIIEIRKPGLGR
jgi:filamentous hemagglutinin